MVVRELFAKLGLATDKRSFSNADRMLGMVKKALVGIVAYKSVKWFGSLINDTRTAADGFNKMAQQIGVSSEALQQLEFAAQIGGTDLNVLRTGLQRFAKQANDVTRGLSTAKDAFEAVGIAATNSEGNLRSVDAMLMDVADRFASMPDGTKKTALAMDLFGRSGAQMIPMLNAGREGVAALREEFVDLGAQIDTETGKEFEGLNDDMLRIRTMFTGIRNQAVKALLPILKKLGKAMIVWMKANKEVLQQRLAKVFAALVAVFSTLGKIVGFVIDKWKALAVIISSAVIASTVLKIVFALKALGATSLITGAKVAAGWLLGMWPLVLLAVGIAALILIVEDLWTAFQGGESVFKSMGKWALDYAVKGFIAIEDTIIRLRRGIGSLLEGLDYLANTEPPGKSFERGTVRRKQRYEDLKAQQAEERAIKARVSDLSTGAIFGTPQVAPGGGKTQTNQMTANITVNAGGTASADDIATKTREAIDQVANGWWRTADAALSQ